MGKMKCLSTNNVNKMAFFNILGPILLNGINFFTIPIFTRLLGTENYGLYTIYATWVNTISIIVSLDVHGTIGVANIHYGKEERDNYYSSILTIALLTFTILLSLILIFLPQFTVVFGLPKPIVIVMMFHGLGMAFVNFATSRYTYEKKAQNTFGVSVILALSGIGLSLFLLTQLKNNSSLYLGRVYGTAIPYMVIGFSLALLFIIKGKTGFSKRYWKFCLPFCLPLIFHDLSHLLLSQADKVMLQKLTTESILGVFGFTVTFVQIIGIIYNAFNNTWVPFYYDDMKAQNIEGISQKTKNYLFLFTSLSIGFVLVAPEVIKLFANEDFWSGIHLIPVMVLGNYMMFLYSFPVNFEFYHKKTVHIALGTGGAGILNCILNWWWIPIWGMLGAAAATSFSYMLLWIFHHLVARYVIKEPYHYAIKDFLVPLIIMIIACLGTGRLTEYIILRWFTAVVVGIIIIKRVMKQKSIF